MIDEDVRTEDASVAERLLGRVHGPTEIRSLEQRFRFRQRVRGDERVTLTRWEIGAPAEVSSELRGLVGVGTVIAGAFQGTTGGLEIDPAAPFAIQPGPIRFRSTRLALAMVNLSQDALEAAAGYSPGTLRCRGTAPISIAASRSWQQVEAFASAEVSDPVTLANPLLRTRVLDLLIVTALTAFPIDGQPLRDRLGAAPRSVRRAISFMEDHAAEPISVTEIAAASGLSARALHAAFRRGLDTTPAARLREIRLERVHRELAAAGPGSGSVAEIARRWGFAHLGRFAGSYRARYGELPSHTLRN